MALISSRTGHGQRRRHTIKSPAAAGTDDANVQRMASRGMLGRAGRNHRDLVASIAGARIELRAARSVGE
jgi:hypothetical protein